MPSLYPLQVISVELSESIDITLGSVIVKLILVASGHEFASVTVM